MSEQNVYELHPSDSEAHSLRVLRVVPPQPGFAPGTYEVTLELSRRLSVYEDKAFHRLARRMHVVGRQLVLLDTTLERVAKEAPNLAEFMRRVEEEGRRLEQETTRRNREFEARHEDNEAQMSALAASIRFPS